MSPAASNGWAIRPPTTIGSGRSRYVSDAATPKFPPPPRRPHIRSGCDSSVTSSTSPSAVTSSTAIRLSQARPWVRHQPAQPAAQRVAGDPGGRDGAPGDGESVRPGRLVDVAPARAALCPGRRRRRVDVDRAHPGQIDHQAALGHRPAGDVVPAAAHRDLQPGVACMAHRRRDVVGVRTAGDQRGPAVDQPVVHPASGVIPLVAGCQERAGERRGERGSGCHGSTSGNGERECVRFSQRLMRTVTRQSPASASTSSPSPASTARDSAASMPCT